MIKYGSQLGIKDFKYCVRSQEYAIFAVKAPVEIVGQELMDNSQGKGWKKQVESTRPIYNTPHEKNSNSFWMPIVQPTTNQWTIVYWSVGVWKDLSVICEEASLILQTRAVSLEQQDTSGFFCYHCK